MNISPETLYESIQCEMNQVEAIEVVFLVNGVLSFITTQQINVLRQAIALGKSGFEIFLVTYHKQEKLNSMSSQITIC